MIPLGRIVQFHDDTYGYQRLLFGFIPVGYFQDLDHDDRVEWVKEARDYCKSPDILEIRKFVKELEKNIKRGKIKRVVKETKLDKALE